MIQKTRIAVLCVVFLGWGWNAFAQDVQARFLTITGTVEVQRRGGGWALAAEGDVVDADTIISTGFKSSASLSLGNSIIQVRPLTRLTLMEITQRESAETVDLYLQTGRIRADVAPPSGGKTDFTIRSPTATASVRGTSFVFDTMGLRTFEGRVQFVGANRQITYVNAGEQSSLNEPENRLISPIETHRAILRPVLPILTASIGNYGRTSGDRPGADGPVISPGVQPEASVPPPIPVEPDLPVSPERPDPPMPPNLPPSPPAGSGSGDAGVGIGWD